MKTELSRLSFIKYLYETGVKYSYQSAPSNSVALFMFHDSIELFLQLASEQLDIGKSHISFIDYWELFQRKKSVKLTHRESIRRLNRARVGLKHHGNMPSKIDIESFRTIVSDFFLENTPPIFGIAFEDVSLIDLIESDETKKYLKKAIQIKKKGVKTSDDIDKALAQILLSFRQLVSDYEKSKQVILTPAHSTIKYRNLKLTFNDLLTVPGSGNLTVPRAIDELLETMKDLENALKLLSYGINYRKFRKFDFLIPSVNVCADGHLELARRDWRAKVYPSPEDIDYCLNFVIESAITLQEEDFASIDYMDQAHT